MTDPSSGASRPPRHFDVRRGSSDDALEVVRLRMRVKELEDQLRIERMKSEFLPDSVMSQGTVTPDVLSPCMRASHAPNGNRNYKLSSEVLVIVDEERRVPTTLADLLSQADGRPDLRERDTPRHGGHSPNSTYPRQEESDDDDGRADNIVLTLPSGQQSTVPANFPLDRIMTEHTLKTMNQNTSHVLALEPISPVANDAFNYVTEAYDKDRNMFHHNLPVLEKLLVDLCTTVSFTLRKEPLYKQCSSPCYVFGDIHGNFSDLSYFLDNVINFRDLHFTPSNFLFLGDYVDRGLHGLECVMVLLSLKLGYPGQVTMLRGNHEDPLVNGDIRHYGEASFKAQCLRLFGAQKGERMWAMVNEQVFKNLPLAADIDKRIFCCHGGIPRFAGGADNRLQTLKHPKFPRLDSFSMFDNAPPEDIEWVRYATDLCWSDPKDRESPADSANQHGFFQNSRGPGTLCFGTRAVDTFLKNNGFEYIFRAHQEKSDGLRLSKSARVVTIFSSSDYEGHRNGAGMLFVSHTGEIRLVIKKAST